MDEFTYPPGTRPAQQAGNILRAWMRHDGSTLHKELKRGMDLCCASEASGLEDEHLELLKAVVGRLNQYPALRGEEPADPVVRLCMDLLLHLAGQLPVGPRLTEPEIPTIYHC